MNANADAVVIEQMVAIARRRWKIVAGATLVALALGYAYGESQPILYSSSATVIVRSGPTADPVRQGVQTSTPEEEGQFLSQLELAKSTNVASRAYDKLGLDKGETLAAFLQKPATGFSKGGDPASATEPVVNRERLVAMLQQGVKVSRQGRTYIAAISYTHGNPDMARAAAQAFADSFRDELDSVNVAAAERVRAVVEAELAKVDSASRAALEEKYRDQLIARAIPGVEAAVISDARLPGAPILPRKSFIVIVAAIIGAAIGAALAGWREMTDRGVRDGDQLARRLGLRFFGYLPAVSAYAKKSTAVGQSGFAMPEDAKHSVGARYSRFSESLRSVALPVLATAEPGRGVVLAITSTLPGEGKTLVAANLASLIGHQGKRVLLIDGQFRDPDLSGWLSGPRETGALEVIKGQVSFAEQSYQDAALNLTFLPAGGKSGAIDPAALIAGGQFGAFLEAQRKNYDVIVLETASMTSAADAVALAPLADAVLLVCEWGGPSPALVETMLSGEPQLREKIAGLLVTKTRLRKLPLYMSKASRGAYQSRIG
jgi:succinoglycan biosynthesis transport protein ExoP